MGAKAIDIPLTGGLQENVNPKTMQSGLLQATNVQYTKREGLVPRNGTVRGPLASVHPVGSAAPLPSPDGLFSLGDTLIATAAGKLYGYAETYGAWALSGAVSQIVVERDGVEASQVLQRDATIATNGTVTVLVWSQVFETAGTIGIFATVSDALTGATLISGYKVASTTDARARPKVAFGSTKFMITWADDSVTAVRCATFDPATIAWGAVTSLVTNRVATTGYAMCARPGSDNFLIAYHSSVATTYRRLLVVSTAPAVVATLTLTDTVADVTTCFGLDCVDVSTCWVVYGRYDSGATNGLRVRGALANVTTPAAPTLTLAPHDLYLGSLGGGNDPTLYSVVECAVKRTGATKAAFAWSLTDDDTGFFGIIKRTACNSMTSTGTLGHSAYAIGVVLATDIFLATFTDGDHVLFGVAPFETLAPYSNGGVIPGLGNAYVLEYQDVATSYVLQMPEHATYAIGQVEVYRNPYNAAAAPRSMSSLSAVIVDPSGNPSWVGFDRQLGAAPSRIHRATARVSGWTRQVAALGGALLLTGGVPARYDGVSSSEYAFQSLPEFEIGNVAAGPLTGAFEWTYCYEWIDATGAVARSAPANPSSDTLAGQQITWTIRCCPLTLKNINAGLNQPAVISLVLYRTTAGSSGPFYRVTAISVPYGNANSVSVPTIDVLDAMSDANLIKNPQLYTTGGVLDAICPPSCQFAVVWKSRFVVAGTDDDSIWYTTEYVFGEAPRFNEGLRFQPFSEGRVTGLAVLQDTLVVFKRDAIYVCAGTPPNDTGNLATSSLSPMQRLVADQGCIDANSIVQTPHGIVFRSRRGLYLLDRNLTVTFVGEGVAVTAGVATSTITSAVLVPDQNQVRFGLDPSAQHDGPALVWDYLTGAWTKFLYQDPAQPKYRTPKYACLNRGRYAFLTDAGQLFFEVAGAATDDASGTEAVIETTVQTPWVHVSGIQGRQQAQRWSVIGEYGDRHKLVLHGLVDYQPIDDAGVAFNLAAPPAGGYQFVHPVPAGQETQAVSLRVDVQGNIGPPSVAPMGLAGIALEVDAISPLARRNLPAAQKG